MKRYTVTQEHPDGKRCIGQGMRKECGASMPSSSTPFSPSLHLFNPGALWTLLFWVFMEVSLLRHEWLNHWPLVIELICRGSVLAWGDHGLIFLWLVPNLKLSRSSSRTHFFNTQRHSSLRRFQWNLCQIGRGWGAKSKYISHYTTISYRNIWHLNLANTVDTAFLNLKKYAAESFPLFCLVS